MPNASPNAAVIPKALTPSASTPDLAPAPDIEAYCPHTGFLLTKEQLYLRGLKKRVMSGFLLNALLLYMCEVLSHSSIPADWFRMLLSFYENLSIFALCIQFSLLVLISCCNLTRRMRF
jgi:hypothetical protein